MAWILVIFGEGYNRIRASTSMRSGMIRLHQAYIIHGTDPAPLIRASILAEDSYYCRRHSSRTHDSGDKNKAARLRGAPLIKYGATPAAAEELKLQAEKFVFPCWKISPQLLPTCRISSANSLFYSLPTSSSSLSSTVLCVAKTCNSGELAYVFRVINRRY